MNRLLYLLILCTGCSISQRSINFKEIQKPVIINSSVCMNEYANYHSRYRCTYIPVYYIGKLNDTILFDQDKLGNNSYLYPQVVKKESARQTAKGLILLVDTTQKIGDSFHYYLYQNLNKGGDWDSIKIFQSYPVFLYNNSNVAMRIGINRELGSTFLQTKNKYGKWENVELPIFYNCVTSGTRQLIIGPNEIAISRLMQFRGNNKSLCRLKYELYGVAIYSNTFYDYIDKRDTMNIHRSYYR